MGRAFAAVVDAAGLADGRENLGHGIGVAGFNRLAQAGADLVAGVGHGVDQGQGGLALGQVVAQVLAQGVGIGGVVEHVVGDLEGQAQVHAIGVHGLLDGFVGARQQRAQARGRREQHRRLALDNPQVGRFVGVGVVHVQQLQHLAFGDLVGGVGQDAHDRHRIELHHQLEAARIQEIAHEHAGRIAPQRVGGAPAAAQVGFVHHVVVQQGRGVDELDDRRQLVRPWAAAAQGPGRQHDQHGSQALAAGGDDVFGNLVDKHHVRGQPAADQGVHGRHLAGGEGLDLGDAGQGNGAGLGGHGAIIRFPAPFPGGFPPPAGAMAGGPGGEGWHNRAFHGSTNIKGGSPWRAV